MLFNVLKDELFRHSINWVRNGTPGDQGTGRLQECHMKGTLCRIVASYFERVWAMNVIVGVDNARIAAYCHPSGDKQTDAM